MFDTNGTPGNLADDFVVNALCPGRTVRFVPDAGRVLQDPTLYFYAVLPGLQVQCTSFTTNSSLFTYTPTAADIAAGQVTVTELANGSTLTPPVPGTFFARTLPVYATPTPAFTLAPCPTGQALVTLTAPTPYDTYQVLVNNVATATVDARRGAGVVSAPAGASITVVGGYLLAPCTGSASQTLAALAPGRAPTPAAPHAAGTHSGRCRAAGFS